MGSGPCAARDEILILIIILVRFVLGEVVAAIHFLHELGFSYGDLKPENVLITELGHIKVIPTAAQGCGSLTFIVTRFYVC
jgi:hypothetical protein